MPVVTISQIAAPSWSFANIPFFVNAFYFQDFLSYVLTNLSVTLYCFIISVSVSPRIYIVIGSMLKSCSSPCFGDNFHQGLYITNLSNIQSLFPSRQKLTMQSLSNIQTYITPWNIHYMMLTFRTYVVTFLQYSCMVFTSRNSYAILDPQKIHELPLPC